VKPHVVSRQEAIRLGENAWMFSVEASPPSQLLLEGWHITSSMSVWQGTCGGVQSWVKTKKLKAMGPFWPPVLGHVIGRKTTEILPREKPA
jgi:hypothetical protein